jgi:site-specific DNA recombinase
MTKAALYARVSTDAQQKEGTIDSQVAELKRQIAAAGHVLVKQYIDDGYSGAELTRPGLRQLLEEAKSDSFKAIYFLGHDRIAREVAHQILIVDELQKYNKQIIINGKEHVNKPDEKLVLTVFGAVSEFERAKIMERMRRGKLHRLRMGQLIGHGLAPFGYEYVRKTPTTPGMLVIDDQEAQAVRWIFEAFAGGTAICAITRSLEERGIRTRMGKTTWDTTHVKNMLRNPTYTGIKYYNRMIEPKVMKADGSKRRGKCLYRDKSEWIAVRVPAIITQELFDRVQKKIQLNKQRYLQPSVHYLLKSLVRCGNCGGAFYTYRRYYTRERIGGRGVYHKAAYECLRRSKENTHGRDQTKRCHNSQVATHLLEDKVFEMIRDVMLDPVMLRAHMDLPKDNGRAAKQRIARRLAKVTVGLTAIGDHKRRLIDLYAAGQIPKEEYVAANLRLDETLDGLTREKIALSRQRSLNDHKSLDLRLRQFCETVKERLESCVDFDTKRQFLLDHVRKIIFLRDKVTLVGSVPIELNHEKQ